MTVVACNKKNCAVEKARTHKNTGHVCKLEGTQMYGWNEKCLASSGFSKEMEEIRRMKHAIRRFESVPQIVIGAALGSGSSRREYCWIWVAEIHSHFNSLLCRSVDGGARCLDCGVRKQPNGQQNVSRKPCLKRVEERKERVFETFIFTNCHWRHWHEKMRNGNSFERMWT